MELQVQSSHEVPEIWYGEILCYALCYHFHYVWWDYFKQGLGDIIECGMIYGALVLVFYSNWDHIWMFSLWSTMRKDCAPMPKRFRCFIF
jgi:hypothetical protein